MSCCCDAYISFSRLRGKAPEGRMGARAARRSMSDARHPGAGRTAFAGLQTRTPQAAQSASASDGASNPVSLLLTVRLPCLFFARPPGGRATFLCVAKERWPTRASGTRENAEGGPKGGGQDARSKERPPRCCAFRPSMDERCVRAGRACRRAIPGAAASGRNPLRPPYGPSRPAPTAAQGPQKSAASMTTILASFGARPHNLRCGISAQEVRQTGAPRTRRAGDGKVRRMAHRMCASSPQAHGCAFGEPRRLLANPEHRDVLRTCSRGGLLFGDFLLATQEKVTRARGTRAEKDMDVMRKAPSGARRDKDVIPPPLRGDLLPSEGGDCVAARRAIASNSDGTAR